jgi:hypothetical protein
MLVKCALVLGAVLNAGLAMAQNLGFELEATPAARQGQRLTPAERAVLLGSYQGANMAANSRYGNLTISENAVRWSRVQAGAVCETTYATISTDASAGYPSHLLGGPIDAKYWTVVLALEPTACLGNTSFLQLSFSQDSMGYVNLVGYDADGKPAEWLYFYKQTPTPAEASRLVIF